MGVDAGSVYSSVRIRLESLDNDLKGVYARLGQLEGKITTSSAKSEGSFKKMFSAVALGNFAVQAAQKGFNVLTTAIKDSIRVSVESQEVLSKYDVVFEGMGTAAEDAAKTFSESFDLAGATAKEMLSNTGNLLQGMGATREESLELSLQVNTLASDLASFTNNAGGSKTASEALTKALLGEREQMKSLGIAILESDVQLRVARNGQDKLTGTALKMARAQATVQLVTEQAKNSIGDYARTSDSAANSQKRAEESTKKLQIAIGTALNPAIVLSANIWSRVSTALSEVINKSNELRDAEKAQKEGNATFEQRILLLEKQKSDLIALSKTEMQYGEDGKVIFTGRAKQYANEISAIQGLLNSLNTQKAIESGKNKIKTEEDKKILDDAKRKEELALRELDQINGRKKANDEYLQAIEKINFETERGLITEEEERQAIISASQTQLDALYNLGYATEDMSTMGRQELEKMIEQIERLTGIRIRDGEEIGHVYENTIKWADITEQGLTSMVSSFGALGEVFAQGELSWKTFAKIGLQAIASIIDAIALEIAALAAREIAFYGFFNPIGWAAAGGDLAKAAAISASAGIVRGFAGSFATGGIVPGNSFTGDNKIANVNSGEMILNGSQQNALFDMLSNVASNNGNINASSAPIYLDGKEIAKVVTRYQRNNKV